MKGPGREQSDPLSLWNSNPPDIVGVQQPSLQGVTHGPRPRVPREAAWKYPGPAGPGNDLGQSRGSAAPAMGLSVTCTCTCRVNFFTCTMAAKRGAASSLHCRALRYLRRSLDLGKAPNCLSAKAGPLGGTSHDTAENKDTRHNVKMAKRSGETQKGTQMANGDVRNGGHRMVIREL